MERDPLFNEAAKAIVENQNGSVSFIQRKFLIGYNRGGRIIDQLEDAKIIGEFKGDKAREVLIPTIEALEIKLQSLTKIQL